MRNWLALLANIVQSIGNEKMEGRETRKARVLGCSSSSLLLRMDITSRKSRSAHSPRLAFSCDFRGLWEDAVECISYNLNGVTREIVPNDPLQESGI